MESDDDMLWEEEVEDLQVVEKQRISGKSTIGKRKNNETKRKVQQV